MTRADLGKDPSQVSAMFDRVAARYDRTNNADTWLGSLPRSARVMLRVYGAALRRIRSL